MTKRNLHVKSLYKKRGKIVKENLTMLTDLYQLTMAYGYFKSNKHTDNAVFDLFYRQHSESPFVIFAGVEQVMSYLKSIRFTTKDIEYLSTLELFDEDFLSHLLNFKFTGTVYAMSEGTIAFPQEPMIRVEGELFQVQLVETTILNIINHQTLIATKANRIVRVADPQPVSDFGLRRAQGADAGLYGARASYIGGCTSTSNVLAGKEFGIPVSGTHAHSWILSFDTELEAFSTYAKEFPQNCILLVDTYDVLKSGMPNAITVFKEMEQRGEKGIGVRLDSGDLAYLSKKSRKMLDQNGLEYIKIYATNDLDEYTIQSLKLQGAMIDVFGVGTKMITSFNVPALGGVYKLSEINGKPRMKRSENISKMTNPAKKMVYRIFSKQDNKALADLIALDADKEQFDNVNELTIYHPVQTWKKTTLEDIYFAPLLTPFMQNGTVVQESTTINARANTIKNMNDFWEEYLRIINPQEYKVDISDGLYDLKKSLLS